MQEAGTYLQEVAGAEQQSETKNVEDFLGDIENQQLYQILEKADKLTLEAILLKIQGFSIAEISALLDLNEHKRA